MTGEHDVQKSGKEEEASIKPETGESAKDVPIPYPVDNAGHNYTVDNGKPQGAKLAAAMADKPVQRTSLRETGSVQGEGVWNRKTGEA